MTLFGSTKLMSTVAPVDQTRCS